MRGNLLCKNQLSYAEVWGALKLDLLYTNCQ